MKDKLNSNLISEDELEAVNGGKDSSGLQKMRVRNYPYGPLAIMSRPDYNEGRVLYRVPTGTLVYTDGRTEQRLNREGKMCSYTSVCFQNQWGYAESEYLEKV